MPLQATSGAASYDAFGGGVPVVPNYIEDVFSCFLYSGTNAAQTITNNIDLSTYGGVVWQKARISAIKHRLFSTNMTLGRSLSSNSIFAEDTAVNITSYSTTGFTVAAPISDTGENYVTWTFRKQPKFFDVQTWTGSGVNRTIAHNLGSVPGCIIVKCIDDDFAWAVYHRSLANTQYLVLNSTAAAATGATWWNSTTPTSAVFSLGTDSTVNALNKSYIAYIYAHDAGGFGLTGTDNVISCGTYTTNGSGVATVDLGYEPQWVLTKATSGTFGTTDWVIADNMRGMPAPPQTDGVGGLFPNLSNAEDNNFNRSVHPTSTGFVANQYNSTPYIYIAIRRGPMKVPTSGTSVFAPVSRSGTSTVTTITAGFAPDFNIAQTSNLGYGASWWDKLRGPSLLLNSFTSSPEDSAAGSVLGYNNTAVSIGADVNEWINGNSSSNIYANWIFQRAPSFSDVVCYTGNGISRTLSHNLVAVPELIIVKRRSAVDGWYVYNGTSGASSFMSLNLTSASTSSSTAWNNTSPTNSVFSVGTATQVNASGSTYVAYLFATCAGVSKVGTYTGNGSTQTIDCGFTGGVRFVLIKRTDSTGDWYVYDTARGMTTLTDPYLRINVQAAQTATLGSVTTVSTGFALNASILAAINTNGASYIFLAIS